MVVTTYGATGDDKVIKLTIFFFSGTRAKELESIDI